MNNHERQPTRNLETKYATYLHEGKETEILYQTRTPSSNARYPELIETVKR